MYKRDPSCPLCETDADLVHEALVKMWRDAQGAYEKIWPKYSPDNERLSDEEEAYCKGVRDAAAILLHQFHMETGRIGQNIDTELLAALDMDHWLK